MSNVHSLTNLALPSAHMPVDVLVPRGPCAVTELVAPLRRCHPNILVIGSGVDVERVLEQIQPLLRVPLAEWSPREMPLPPSTKFRSLIVRDVERLTGTQQRSLATLLGRSGGDFQIVSIATVTLFPLVCQGLFLEDLYYRLNVVLLEHTA